AIAIAIPTRGGTPAAQNDRPLVIDRAWSFLTTEAPRHWRPAVDRDSVYLPLTSGRLVALQLDNGAERWSAETGQIDPAPVTASSWVIIVIPSSGEGPATGSIVRALDRATGKTAWEKTMPAGAVRLQYCDPPGILLLSQEDGTLTGLRPGDGTVTWTVALPEAASSECIIEGSTLWVGTGKGHLCRIDLHPGTPRLGGTVRLDAAIRSRPGLSARSVFAATSGGNLYRIDRRGLKVKWTRRLGAAVSAAVVPQGSQVIAACYDNYVYSFDQQSGDPRWRRLTAGRIVNDLFPAGIELWVAPLRANRLLALDPASGSVIRTIDWDGDSGVSGPIAGNGQMILIPTDEGVYAANLAAKAGAETKSWMPPPWRPIRRAEI
ncbi:MAG: PQQ-binding-like beta-propeller repeat protein, partial [Acidobacteria bacterium]|nr:PQQ-binding-like beta-propeller repeat protein [Acidobacteriota bacterium]